MLLQIKLDSFLEDLNNVLSAGDVPNIYDAEELDKIYQQMRGVVTDQGLQATRSNMFSAYQRTVKANLHCIITMRCVALAAMRGDNGIGSGWRCLG